MAMADAFAAAASVRLAVAPFPLPAHRTGRADFRHPALRLASPQGTRRTANLGWCLATTPWHVTNLRLAAELPLKPSDTFRCYQAHRQSPILGSFESAPEVRVLSSTGITRPQRSYDPVRLPPGPPCLPRRWSCDLRPKRASPDYPDHLPNVPCPLPRWIGTGAYVGCFPIPRGLPRETDGSASTNSLSRPAQASLALRPAGSLDRPRRPLSRGFETDSYPTAPLVSYQINRQLSGWYLPPLVFRAFGAHCPFLAAFCQATRLT